MNKVSKWLKKYFVPREGNEFKPHFLRHQTMLIFFCLIIVIELGFLAQVFIIFDKTKFLAEVLPAVLQDLTNQERAQNGAGPLTESPLLDKAAQDKANDMAQNGYFAHTSPDGKTPWYWFNLVGYNYIYAGENLAVNFFESQDVANAWMNSPAHRDNIVKKDYTQIGFGVATGVYEGRSTVFVAQLFGTPLVFPTTSPTTDTASPETPQASATPKTVPSTPTVAKTTSAKNGVTIAISKPKTASKPTSKPVTVTTSAVQNTPAVVPVSTPPPVPVAVKVLGDETTTTPSVPVTTISTTQFAKESSLRSFVQRTLSSPRQSVSYAYEVLGLLILTALMIMFVRSELHHKKVMVRGFALIAVILILSYINIRVLNIKTQVPTDDHNQITASVINALPQ